VNEQVSTPFTDDQVASLNAYQAGGPGTLSPVAPMVVARSCGPSRPAGDARNAAATTKGGRTGSWPTGRGVVRSSSARAPNRSAANRKPKTESRFFSQN
jgi:hypothetical protein